MRKVKIFDNKNKTTFEKDVNEFIKDKNVIDIRYAAFPVPTAFNQYGDIIERTIYERAVVIYEEKETDDLPTVKKLACSLRNLINEQKAFYDNERKRNRRTPWEVINIGYINAVTAMEDGISDILSDIGINFEEV